jgi:hypothetical protein
MLEEQKKKELEKLALLAQEQDEKSKNGKSYFLLLFFFLQKLHFIQMTIITTKQNKINKNKNNTTIHIWTSLFHLI